MWNKNIVTICCFLCVQSASSMYRSQSSQDFENPTAYKDKIDLYLRQQEMRKRQHKKTNEYCPEYVIQIDELKQKLEATPSYLEESTSFWSKPRVSPTQIVMFTLFVQMIRSMWC